MEILRGVLSPLNHFETPDASVLSQGFWEQAVCVVTPQGLLPFLIYRFDINEKGFLVPSGIRERSRRQYVRNWQRAQQQMNVLVDIIGACQKVGIDMMLLKGLYYCDVLYAGNRGLRPSNDVDLAVRLDDRDVFLSLLTSGCIGGRMLHVNPLMARATVAIKDIAIEVHWSPTTLNPFDDIAEKLPRDEGVWNRSEQWLCGPHWIRVPSLPDIVCALAEHMIILDDLVRKPLRHTMELAQAWQLCHGRDCLQEIGNTARARGHPCALQSACYALRFMLKTDAQYCRAMPILKSKIVGWAVRGRIKHGHRPKWATSLIGKVIEALRLSLWNGVFAEDAGARLTFVACIVAPSRSFASHIAGRQMRSWQYALYLVLFHPLVIVASLPTFVLLLVRQLEDVTKCCSRRMRGGDAQTIQ